MTNSTTDQSSAPYAHTTVHSEQGPKATDAAVDLLATSVQTALEAERALRDRVDAEIAEALERYVASTDDLLRRLEEAVATAERNPPSDADADAAKGSAADLLADEEAANEEAARSSASRMAIAVQAVDFNASRRLARLVETARRSGRLRTLSLLRSGFDRHRLGFAQLRRTTQRTLGAGQVLVSRRSVATA